MRKFVLSVDVVVAVVVVDVVTKVTIGTKKICKFNQISFFEFQSICCTTFSQTRRSRLATGLLLCCCCCCVVP